MVAATETHVEPKSVDDKIPAEEAARTLEPARRKALVGLEEVLVHARPPLVVRNMPENQVPAKTVLAEVGSIITALTWWSVSPLSIPAQ